MCFKPYLCSVDFIKFIQPPPLFLINKISTVVQSALHAVGSSMYIRTLLYRVLLYTYF